jgi:uncharacterized protein (DUF58 family)
MISGDSAHEILRRLELVITRKLDGLLQGDYRGLLPAHGSELGETREYQPGDDVRRIDWNVTARTVTPHVRDTIADRELETWLLVDLSPSLDFGTAECQKRDLVLAAAGALGFLTARGGNRIGAVLATVDGVVVHPARSGRQHLLALLHRIATARHEDGGGRTDLGPSLERLGATMRRSGLAVVISDFLSQPGPDAWAMPMRRLAVRHDVLAIETVDRRELELPDVGLLTVVDPESGDVREIQTSNAGLRQRYARAAAEQRDAIAGTLRRAGADHLVLRTDRDWLDDIVRFVVLRRRRVDRGATGTGVAR